MGVGKCAKAFLPRKSARNPAAIIVLAPNQALSALDSQNNMDVNLCVGVGHDMPLLVPCAQQISLFLSRPKGRNLR
jgi:hypothetical protein